MNNASRLRLLVMLLVLAVTGSTVARERHVLTDSQQLLKDGPLPPCTSNPPPCQ